MACRVICEPEVSREIEYGVPELSFSKSASRVVSPSAAKTRSRYPASAAFSTCGFIRRTLRAVRFLLLRFLGDIFFDILHLLRPATLVHAERFRAPVRRDLLESGFAQKKESAGRDL